MIVSVPARRRPRQNIAGAVVVELVAADGVRVEVAPRHDPLELAGQAEHSGDDDDAEEADREQRARASPTVLRNSMVSA